MKNYIPLCLISLLFLILYFTGYSHMISFETLREHHKELREIVMENPMIAPIIFMIISAIAISLALPGGYFLSLFSGFLFAEPWPMFYIMISMTLGSTIFFLCGKKACKNLPKEKIGNWLVTMDKEFHKNATSYMLFFRFIPLIPFWTVNSIASFFTIPTKTFLWTTFLGIAPQAFLFSHIGNRLNEFFEKKGEFSLIHILSPKEIIILSCLGILATIPIFIKKIQE